MADIEKKQDEKVEKKSKAKKDKPSLGSRIASWFRGFKAEFKKIIWPTQHDVIRETTAVVVVSCIIGVIIALLDFLIQHGIDFLVNLHF